MNIILSLDISTSTGYCVMYEKRLIAYGIIKLKGKELQERCNELACFVEDLELKYKPDFAVIEDTFVGPNPRTTALLNKLQGAVIKTLTCPIISIIAKSARKKVLGKDEGKQKAFDSIVKMYNFKDFVFKKHNDITDAIVLALSGY